MTRFRHENERMVLVDGNLGRVTELPPVSRIPDISRSLNSVRISLFGSHFGTISLSKVGMLEVRLTLVSTVFRSNGKF